MIVIVKGPAATHGDESRIPDLREDQRFPIWVDARTDPKRYGVDQSVAVTWTPHGA